MLEAQTQNVAGEVEEDVADDKEDISRDPDQDIGLGKESGSTEDAKPSGPHDEKKEESEESSTEDGDEGDLRSRKKSRVNTSLSLTFSTPSSKDEGSPAQAKGLIKSPSITKLAEKFEVAPSKRTTRGNKIKTPEKVSPGKKQETPGKQDPPPTAIKTKHTGQLSIEHSMKNASSSKKPQKKQNPKNPPQKMEMKET